jgi:ribosomal protein S12 methylthiotransferase
VVRQQRRDRLMEIQQEGAFAHTAAQVGKEVEVIVDGPDPEVPGHFLARTAADAPDIDCVVRLKGRGLQPGNLVLARVTGADGYDLMARAIRVR